jgi:carboxyl-terminal processing protease
MQSAIRIADEMLAADHTIVKTRGRDEGMNNEFNASDGDVFETQPVIVLVNGNSASASEIVSGALQDEDRALIVGQRTFGKGLIQKQFELTDGSMLQMTVGRYYTPAGRLIQTPYEDGDLKDYYEQKFSNYDKATYNPSEYKDSIPDSLKHTTDHGRTVFGGGGILPDYVVTPDTSRLFRAVVGNGLDRLFVLDWFKQNEQQLRDTWTNRRQAFIDSYTVDDSVVNAFWSFAKENGLSLTSDPAEVSTEDGVFLRAEATQEKERLKTYLKARIAGRLYGGRSAYPILNAVDQDLNHALTLWDRAEALAAYHTPSTAGTTRGGDN